MKNYIAIIASLLIYPHALFATSKSIPSLKTIAAQSFLAQAPKINKPRAIHHFYAPPHDTDYDNYFSCVTRSAKQHIEAANIPEDLKPYLYTKAKQNITKKKNTYQEEYRSSKNRSRLAMIGCITQLSVYALFLYCYYLNADRFTK